jgi:ATP-dependent DNA helicase RecG
MGEKGYVVLPLIQRSAYFSELRSIEADTPYFLRIFTDIGLGIISGRSGHPDKDKILAKFARGEIKLLITTTVIEVGIDVTDASFIVIENADRYGLSQLHQLRGRVGRGGQQSHCYLVPSKNPSGKGRLRCETIVQTTNGFKIAEMDLKMRGGGMISGLEQSGSLDFKIGDVIENFDIFKAAQRDASLILRNREYQNRPIKEFLRRLDDKIKSVSFS